MSVRLRLFLLVLCVVVPCVAAMGWAISSAYRGEKESVEQSLRETTRAMAAAIGGEIAVRDAVAYTLAGSPSLISGDLATFHAQAQAATQRLGGWVVVVDDQAMRVNTLLPLGAPMPARTADPAKRRTRVLADRPYLSALFRAEIAGELTTAVTVPARGQSGQSYEVSVTLPPRALHAVLEAQRLPTGWIGAVIDQQGTVVARLPNHDTWLGKPATQDMRTRIGKDSEGYFRSVSLDGQPSDAYFSRVPGRDWTFVIAVPESLLRSDARDAVAKVAGAALLMLLLASLAALAAGRRIVESARQLQRTARALESDADVYYLPAGVAELDAAGTALVHAARQLRVANRVLVEEVEAAVRQAQAAQEQIAAHQRLEALGRLTGGVAHDVNNLLAVVSNNAALLKALPPTAPRDAPLAAISRSVLAGRALTQKLLSFARQRTQAASRVDLQDWLPALQALLRTSVDGRVQLEVTVAPGTAPLRVDAAELELALLNLAVNAGHAMPEGGQLSIVAANADASVDATADVDASATRNSDGAHTAATAATATTVVNAPTGRALANDGAHGAMVSITVRDTGAGIPDNVLPRIFEPFFTTKDKVGGSGLGLSQVYGFCTQSGGSVRASSVPGEGTVFTLLLPADTAVSPDAAAAAGVDSAAPDVAVAQTLAPAGSLVAGPEPLDPVAPRARLLYVEDNVDLAESTRALLRASGYAVHWAADGEQALAALARESSFDAVLSDYVMPGSVNGLHLGLHVRATRPRLPFVLLTGYAEQAAEAVAAGFTVLHKPCNADELGGVLNRLIAPVQPGSAV